MASEVNRSSNEAISAYETPIAAIDYLLYNYHYLRREVEEKVAADMLLRGFKCAEVAAVLFRKPYEVYAWLYSRYFGRCELPTVSGRGGKDHEDEKSDIQTRRSGNLCVL